MTEEEAPRLYSKPSRLPQDIVFDQHREIHNDLERWALWNKLRYQPATCASLEKFYTKGGDTTPPSTAPAPVNPRHMALERAVLRMLFQHGETVRLYYVKQRTPSTICRIMAVKADDWPKWMGDCRDMVIYLLEN